MYLDKLEIFGFKSFAKKTVLTFPRGITCIVGPNGCGKSNIADAIRWLLGEQSFKNLRAEKNEDLIFVSGKKRLSFTQATLYLRDNKNSENKYVKISRKFFRNGDNEYLINENKVRREDLLFYLAQIGFGQKSYSIIGQGMVDWILYSSREEKKRFFDEATGIIEYQIKKTKAINKIRRSLKNLSQTEVAIKEVEPRLRFLSRQIKKWEKRQEIEEKLIDSEKDYYGAKLFRLETESKKIEKEFEEKKKILEKEESDFKTFQDDLKNLASYEPDKEFKKIQRSWQNVLEKKNKLIAEKENLKAEIYKKSEKGEAKKINFAAAQSLLHELAKDQKDFLSKLGEVKNLEEIQEIKKIAEKILTKIDETLEIFSSSKKTEGSSSILIEIQKRENGLKIVEEEAKILEEKVSNFLGIENEKRKEMLEVQKKLQDKQNHVSHLSYELRGIEMEKVRLETREEDLKNEIQKEAHFKDLSSFPKISLNLEEEEDKYSTTQRLKKEMELIGSFDENLFQEFKECNEKYDFLSSQIEDLRKSIDSLGDVKKKLDEKIRNEFLSNFDKINKNFDKYFNFLFNGGKAKLVLEEERKITENNIEEKAEKNLTEENQAGEKSEEEFEEEESEEIKYGVEIYARPPRKKNKSIQALSGGEKALTSLALIFAILKTKNPPFVVLDEVDAALDEANSLRFTEIAKELAKDIQLIVITHNPIAMESASALYGVTMDKEGTSHLVSLRLEAL